MTRGSRGVWLALASGFLWSSSALALEAELTPPLPVEIGASSTFTVEVSGAVGTPLVRWTFGDGAESEFVPNGTTVEHTYAAPGHYSVVALVQDDETYASRAFVHAVHEPLTDVPAQVSSPLLVDEERGLILAANTDNGTVTFVDSGSLEKVVEVPVFGDPIALAFAPDGLLWVLDREHYAVAIVDVDLQRAVDFFRLPYASMPMGLVFAPSGDAYITSTALGEVFIVDAVSHEVLARKAIAPSLRGITISGDGASLWVTRFLSPAGRGEVYRLDAATLDTVARYDLLEDTTTEDSDVQGRGLPNYLFSVAVSPTGTRAWVPSKKDNLSRGLERDGLAITQDNAVRPLVSVLDLTTDAELLDERIDLDDRNLPEHVTFSPVGDWAFISVFGSSLVELRDTYSGAFVTALRSDGLMGPVASVLHEGRLYVLADLARELFVFDVVDLMNGVDQSTKLLGQVPLVRDEKLSPEVLRGKQIFANAEDKRMASEGYLSCSSCHFDGFEDGLVWDFFDRGEGFRNTTSLLGRRGMGHGRVHWSANFDEIQDFDGPIRAHQGGAGFIASEDLDVGTRSEPLGDPKAGLDPDLDALADYVTSLESIPRSPYRDPDGALTEAALRGQVLFDELGCATCHAGEDFTDSTAGEVHDVGTMTEMSGSRLGGELTGIDTPTLLGIWQTAPYLHDGSAATLRDVLTTRNASNLHGDTSSVSEAELDDLVEYLLQVDHGLPPVELTLPPPPTTDEGGGDGGMGGMPGVDGGGTGGELDGAPAPGDGDSGCGCRLARSNAAERGWLLGAFALLLVSRRASRRASDANADS